ncbi:putative inorganic phosphate cotransporter [Anastrepha ludens]|uniref:putative inorganic phosphate cotransporter n=1 Tax=Anastrepha ludens TaxID=28586 RepID=UPI0023B09375|nr:putative inorganic phosphate cotransporter [Anastrepha ludens]XP_053963648.1 putative inorganic phosphate cotransporter [Anastrepha ludens]XP_053963649.1 putative inorganic phosphate cotransporter [Anastrepha ludens]
MVFCCDCFNGGYQPIDAARQGPRFGVRHLQCFLAFCGLAVAYALRVNLSVAIVAMTDRNSTNPAFEEFDWDESIKSYLLSSFFWGYVVTQVPGGYLAHHYGAKYTFLFGVLICSCLAILTPFCAHVGDWPLVLALRAAQGLSQGMIFPSTHTFLSKWAPAEERGRLVSYCYSGSQFGTVVMLFVSGYIASSWLGWPSIFYLSGIVGILWSFVWYYCSSSTPAEHPSISVAELRYIESSGQVRRPSDAGRTTGGAQTQAHKVPWAAIFTSPPFLTLIFVHSSNNWGFWTLLTEIPTYMKNILGVDIRSNGPLSALPYFAMCLLSYGFIFLADILNAHFTMPLWVSRKLFNTIGQWVPMAALMGLGYINAGGSFKLAVTLLTIAVGANAAAYLGSQVNHIDLAPNFAGTMMGITNCVANVMSIIAPLTVGLIVTDEKNPAQWRIVFYVSAFFYFAGNLLFLIFGRTSPQKWNFPETRTNNVESADNRTDDTQDLTDDENAPLNRNAAP